MLSDVSEEEAADLDLKQELPADEPGEEEEEQLEPVEDAEEEEQLEAEPVIPVATQAARRIVKDMVDSRAGGRRMQKKAKAAAKPAMVKSEKVKSELTEDEQIAKLKDTPALAHLSQSYSIISKI